MDPEMKKELLQNSVHLQAVPNPQTMSRGQIAKYALDIVSPPIQPLQLPRLKEATREIRCDDHPFMGPWVFDAKKSNP